MTTWGAAFNYDDANDSRLASFGTVVAGRQSVMDGSNGFYRELMQQGVEVQQYLNVVDVNGYVGGEFDRRFSSGAPALNLSNWSGFKIVDISNAAWRAKLTENFRWVLGLDFPEDRFGLFLDVFGERLWVGAWDQMNKGAFSSGMRALGEEWVRLRDERRPGMKMTVNGTWANGFPGMCPCVEHHGLDDYWRGYVNPAKWDHRGDQGFAFIIAQGSGDAPGWRSVPGVGPIAGQGDYARPGFNVASGARAVTRKADTTPTPQPDPTPTPTPTPEGDYPVHVKVADKLKTARGNAVTLQNKQRITRAEREKRAAAIIRLIDESSDLLDA